ncbi:MAG TPA: pentapeptide repeat-containing protein [Ktedonobacteraceae bacterium]|nr:pentapeptide repeat-containing protein [Ktedonobacteraceae bacterium]
MRRKDLHVLKNAGVTAWNVYRRGCSFIPDLSRANLSRLDLRGVDLSHSRLYRTNLSEADLRGASFKGTDLTETSLWCANLEGANLQWVSLYGTYQVEVNLRAADLRGADLSYAHVKQACLRGATVKGTTFWGTRLQEVDLREVDLSDIGGEGPDFQKAVFERVMVSADAAFWIYEAATRGAINSTGIQITDVDDVD